MARPKKGTLTVRSLLDAWQRPEGAGRPIAALATTFEFDAPFYERELLPRFLGCGHDAFNDELLFILERESRLADAYAAVLVDSANVCGVRTSSRWDQIAVKVETGCLHAKVSILAWEKTIRLIVASANLTSGGYRLNHEIAQVLDFQDTESAPPRSVLEVFRDALGRWVNLSPSDNHAVERFTQALGSIREQTRTWREIPRDLRPRAAVDIVPIIVEPGKRESYFDAIKTAVGTTKFDRCWIMSPFWDDNSEEPTTDDAAAASLHELLRVRSARVTVIARGALLGNGAIAIEAPARVRDTLVRSVGADDVSVAPVVLKPGESEGDRRLHAKALWLYDGPYRVLVSGSSNFTAAGTGVERRRCNVEANLAILVRQDAPACALIDEISPPHEDERPAADAQWSGSPKNDDSAAAAEACAPPFLVAATWFADSRSLKLTLLTQPSGGLRWSMGLPEDDRIEVLWLSASRPENATMHTIKLDNLTQSGPAALHLEWERAGEKPFARIPVTVADRSLLPIVDAMRPLTMDELLDLLVSGKPVWEMINTLAKPSKKNGSASDVLDPHALVDTSRYLTTRVRRFSHALAALRDQLAKAKYATVDSLRGRLFGSTGPESLARAIVAEAGLNGTEDVTGMPLLPRELAAFFLAELALVIRWSPPPVMINRQFFEVADAEWKKLRESIHDLLQLATGSSSLESDLESYAQRVLRLRPVERV